MVKMINEMCRQQHLFHCTHPPCFCITSRNGGSLGSFTAKLEDGSWFALSGKGLSIFPSPVNTATATDGFAVVVVVAAVAGSVGHGCGKNGGIGGIPPSNISGGCPCGCCGGGVGFTAAVAEVGGLLPPPTTVFDWSLIWSRMGCRRASCSLVTVWEKNVKINCWISIQKWKINTPDLLHLFLKILTAQNWMGNYIFDPWVADHFSLISILYTKRRKYFSSSPSILL